MKPRISSAIAVAMGCMCLVDLARASPAYPGELRDALGLAYTPNCTLCHSQTPEGAGVVPVDTPFGKSMVERGLLGQAATTGAAGSVDAGTIDPTMLAALAAMRRDDVDSDGDGAQDLDELSWGADPNVFDGFHSDPVPPAKYGCQMGRRSGSNSAAWFMLLGVVAIFARRIR